MTSSDFFAAVPPETRAIVDAARHVVLSVAPAGSKEIACQSQRPRSASMMWKLVRYVVDGETVVTIGTFTRHSSIFFARGTELEDEDGVLEGGGKVLRYITLRTPADAKRREVKDLVRKAFALVSQRRPKDRRA